MVIDKSGFFSSNFICEECGLNFNNQNRAEEHEIECRRNPLIKTIINSPLGMEGYVQEIHCPYPECSYTETDGIFGSMLRDSVRFPGEYPDFDNLWKMYNDWEGILTSCPKCYSNYFIDMYLKTRPESTNSEISPKEDDKFTKLKELKEMLSEGLIDDDDFKHMKNEILGK